MEYVHGGYTGTRWCHALAIVMLSGAWSGAIRAETPGAAAMPRPYDHATHVDTSTSLSWTPGEHAESHVIYLGTDRAAVASATDRYMADMEDDGDVDLNDYGLFQRCFSGPGVPQPRPECRYARLDHDDDVDADDHILFMTLMTRPNVPATVRAHPEYQGEQSSAIFDPVGLENGRTYDWRVDEVNQVGTTIGDVWSFTPGTTYRIDSRIVFTSVFVWYTSDTGQLISPWLPIETRPGWTGEVDFWIGQIKQMMMANVDVLLVHISDKPAKSWRPQRRNLLEALATLRGQGYDVPRVAPFLDPAIIWHLTTVDLATETGRDALVEHYIQFFQDFYEFNQDSEADRYLCQIDGRVVLDTYLAWPDEVLNQSWLKRDDVANRLSSAFSPEHPVFDGGVYMIRLRYGNFPTWADEVLVQFETSSDYLEIVDYNGLTTAQIKGGYWDQNFRTPGSFLPRDGGNPYVNAWADLLLRDEINHVHLESWNEYDEGSGIYAVDIVNSPWIKPDSQNPSTDVWSTGDDPFEYIRTAAEGARLFHHRPDLGAELIGHNMPLVMAPGGQKAVRITMRNAGDVAWSGADGFALGERPASAEVGADGQDRWFVDDAANEVEVYGGVFRGRPVTFDVMIAAPAQPGTYDVRMQMTGPGDAWFGEALSTTITVE